MWIIGLLTLSGMLAYWPVTALAQQEPQANPPTAAGSLFASGEPDSEGDGSRSASPAAATIGPPVASGEQTTTGQTQEVDNRHVGKLALKSFYDFDHDGFHWATEDDEYSLGVRGMTQLDARLYRQSGRDSAVNGFYNPRTRFYFEGNFTKPVQYEFSFQNTFDTVALLDAYVNFNYDPRFQVRIGRYKTPFTYEWYHVHIWDTLAPERSLFATNFEGQRRYGVMGWGVLFDDRVEYAVGTFNAQRNSNQPFSNRQDVMAFLNFKPFYDREEGFWLRDLHVGGSVDAGHEQQATLPAALRTNAAPSAAAFDSTSAGNAATLPFLAFNPGVLERGDRALGELHAAYYYGGLSLLGAVQGGYESYAKGPVGSPARIPINGWFVQAGYLLTGETIRDRGLIHPLHPFDLREGRFGIGAWEVTARYSELSLDARVFTAGLADPKLWTNEARLVDVGVNWYLNKFVKVYFDWEHAIFGSPVFSNVGRFQKSNDLFWLRTQVYF
jgi:phosphate-selective porin OprO and OprP